MPAPGRILFFGSAPTVGDAGIGLAILQDLRELFPGVAMEIATGEPDDYAALGLPGEVLIRPKPMLRRGHPLAAELAAGPLLHALRRRALAGAAAADRESFAGAGLVVFQGGPQGNDVFLPREKLVELDLRVAAAHAAGAPVVFWGQGFGPFAWAGLEGFRRRRLARRLFRGVDLIATRDAASAPALRRLGVPTGGGRVVEAADAAVRMRVGPADEAAADAALRRAGVEPGGRLLAVCLRDLRGRYGLDDAGHERVLAAVAAALDSAGSAFDRVLFCSTDHRERREADSDLAVMRAARERMRSGEGAVMIEEKLGPAPLAALYGRCRVLLAGRLHPAIFAAGRGTPSVMLGYTHKCDDFMVRLGLADACLPVASATPEAIATQLHRLDAREGDVNATFARGMETLRADAGRTVEAVRRLCDGGRA